jgi:hypothetical protein
LIGDFDKVCPDWMDCMARWAEGERMDDFKWENRFK